MRKKLNGDKGKYLKNNTLNIEFVKDKKIDKVTTVRLLDLGFKYDIPKYFTKYDLNNYIIDSFYEKTIDINSEEIELKYLDLIIEGCSEKQSFEILLEKYKKYRITRYELALFLKERNLLGINKELYLNIIEEFKILINEIIPRCIQDLFYYIGLDTNGAYWIFYDIAIREMNIELYDDNRKNNYRQAKTFVTDRIKKLILNNVSLQEIYDTTCASKSLIKSVIKSIKSNEFPSFKGSKGERLIESILLDLNIVYKREVCFEDFKKITGANFNGRYDFVVYDNKNRVKHIIEFDGQQHFKFIKRFHENKNGFEQQLYRDNIKNLYCEKKKIKLTRINYKDVKKAKSILLNSIYEK